MHSVWLLNKSEESRRVLFGRVPIKCGRLEVHTSPQHESKIHISARTEIDLVCQCMVYIEAVVYNVQYVVYNVHNMMHKSERLLW